MSATKGYTGKGTILSIGTPGGTETFVPIAQIKTFQFSGQQWSFDQVTNAGSPVVGAGVLEENIPSVQSGGTLAVSGVYLSSDAGQTALATAFASGALIDLKLQLPIGPGQTTTGNLFTCSGYVMEMPLPDVQFDKALTFKCTFKINTVVTVALGS